IEPALVVETCRLDHEGVALPSADRVSEPRRLHVLRKWTAIREHLTKVVVLLEQQHRQPGRVDELDRSGHEKVVQDGVRQAAARRSLFASSHPLLVLGFCSWKQRERRTVRRPQSDDRILAKRLSDRRRSDGGLGIWLPHSRQVYAAVGEVWGWRLELGLPIRGSRNARIAITDPLSESNVDSGHDEANGDNKTELHSHLARSHTGCPRVVDGMPHYTAPSSHSGRLRRLARCRLQRGMRSLPGSKPRAVH